MLLIYCELHLYMAYSLMTLHSLGSSNGMEAINYDKLISLLGQRTVPE